MQAKRTIPPFFLPGMKEQENYVKSYFTQAQIRSNHR